MQRARRLALFLMGSLLAMLLLSSVAVAGVSPAPPMGAVVVSLDAPADPAPFAKPFTLTGTTSPPTPGLEILVIRADDSGKILGAAVTSTDGSFSLELRLKRPNSIVARAVSLDATSEPIDIAVRPKLTVSVRKVAAFTDATVKIAAKPIDASGIATLTIRRNGKTIGTARTRIRNGRASEKIVAPGPGAYAVIVDFDAPGGYAKASARTTGRAKVRPLRVGASGADVAGLIRKLKTLNVHVPRMSQDFTSALTDSVIAFQKVSGLPRTGALLLADWRALAKASPIAATRKGPPNRIEVDKTRQILIKVRGGKVVGVLPVSTGATGNTPEGRHAIRWKAPSTTTWLGPGILYRTLTFFGNSFAIHGWSSVPSYPASHGCVRVPIWTADWLYERSPVGETVIVHR